MNEAGKVRVGIIGPSWWVDYWHLPAIQNHPNAIITGVCGERPRGAAEVKAKYGAAAEPYTDMEQMLDRAPLDGVIVCTPNDLHYPATMAALRRGLHVTCEKPVALNAAQAREMMETAQAKGLIGMTNFPYRGNPAVQALRRLVAEGYVGTPLHMHGLYHGGFGLGRPPGWRGLRERSGAGILGDLGSHLIDLARFASGDEFQAVCASSLTVLWDQNADRQPTPVPTEDPRVGPRNDDACAFLAEFASGMQGVFHTSWVAYQGALRQRQEIEVYGTEGRLHWTATFAGTLLRGLKVGAPHWETIPVEGTVQPGQMPEENEDYFRPGRLDATNTTYRWIEAIRTGQRAISPDLEDGWRSQQVIDAVLRASAERRWVAVGG
ncbi:MAG TPA: Gfo/Idh/MocA family oxidoreductase [Chthonomonadaceae bacterium]|nr:Gfo/Idh/MocA family oxidoreductase [Chthonomonadaceae bacterium]